MLAHQTGTEASPKACLHYVVVVLPLRPQVCLSPVTFMDPKANPRRLYLRGKKVTSLQVIGLTTNSQISPNLWAKRSSWRTCRAMVKSMKSRFSRVSISHRPFFLRPSHLLLQDCAFVQFSSDKVLATICNRIPFYRFFTKPLQDAKDVLDTFKDGEFLGKSANSSIVRPVLMAAFPVITIEPARLMRKDMPPARFSTGESLCISTPSTNTRRSISPRRPSPRYPVIVTNIPKHICWQVSAVQTRVAFINKDHSGVKRFWKEVGVSSGILRQDYSKRRGVSVFNRYMALDLVSDVFSLPQIYRVRIRKRCRTSSIRARWQKSWR